MSDGGREAGASRGSSRPRITVTVITFNEEQDVEACLRSVSWADQVIVVDSLSTDATPAIVHRCGATLIQRPFPGFSAQRNFAAEQATGDWVLQLDADERVPPVLRDEILRVAADPASCDLYHIARRNLWLGRWVRHGGWYPDYAPRLFRRGRGRWEGHTHERFVVEGKTGTLRNDLLHDNLKSVQEHLLKQITSIAEEVRDAHRNGLRFCWLPPAAVVGEFVRRFLRGPKTWFSFRLLYKELIKNRVEFVWMIPFATPGKFLYMYVLRLGFLDGAAGFWVASLSAVYTTMRYARLWEYTQRAKHPGTAAVPTDQEMQEIYRKWWPSG